MDNCQNLRQENESAVVSFDSEQLILVNHADEEIGHLSKAECHKDEGILHRAFSLFIFDTAGRLLIQRRSQKKRLWPRFWANSCCSHPRRGETMEQAIHRRLDQELGLTSDLRYLYKFIYQAKYGTLGAEHEYCWVYIGRANGTVTANHNEIEEWRFIAPQELDEELAGDPSRFAPWFKLEWERLRTEYAPEIGALTSSH